MRRNQGCQGTRLSLMPSAERRDDRVSGSIRRVFALIVGFSGVSWLAMNASKSGTIPL
ncbi:MAG: hypothetical protein RXP27_03865 [Nitrososphaeria archaeon]